MFEEEYMAKYYQQPGRFNHEYGTLAVPSPSLPTVQIDTFNPNQNYQYKALFGNDMTDIIFNPDLPWHNDKIYNEIYPGDNKIEGNNTQGSFKVAYDYNLNKADTLELIATQYGIDFSDLTQRIGNEYISARTFIDNGISYILTAVTDLIHLPYSIPLGSDIAAIISGAAVMYQQGRSFMPFVNRIDPLVLDLDGDGVELVSLQDSNVHFDLNNNGIAIATGWVKADDGMLAMDENGNGTIDDIHELFGNANTNGFADLSAIQYFH